MMRSVSSFVCLSAFIFSPYAGPVYATAIVGPGITSVCGINSATPTIDAGSSDSSGERTLRTRSAGALFTKDVDFAFQGFGFIPIADGVVDITVPNINFVGLLDAHGVGNVNHANVRISVALHQGGEVLDEDVVHSRNHKSGGSIVDGDVFSFVEGNLSANVEAGEFHSIVVRLETEAQGVSTNADYLSNEEGGQDFDGRRVIFGCPIVEANIPDSDKDGIPDEWESAIINGLDLPGMGATPDHKDIFVEMDWLPGREPKQGAVRAVKEAFALAPLDNPDESTGIRLHIDTGDLTDPDASEDDQGPGTCGDGINNDPAQDAHFDTGDPDCLVGDLVFSTLPGGGNFGRGTEIPLSDLPNGATLVDLTSDLDGNDLVDFFEVGTQHFDVDIRGLSFYYGISSENLSVGGGQASLGGNTFILGARNASTLMHELGHNLGLQHGGDEGDVDLETVGDEGNCKPNYVSVMNYQHSANSGIPTVGANSGQDVNGDGIPDNVIVDFSPPRRADGSRGEAPLAQLNESALDDTLILDAGDPDNRFIFVDANDILVMRNLNEAADWNSGPGSVNSVNINTSAGTPGLGACTNDRTNDILNGYDDWANMVLGIQGVGDPVAGPYRPTLIYEPTESDIDAFISTINRTDLAITKSHSPELIVAGQPFTYTLTVENKGPNPARQVQVIDKLPQDFSVIDMPDFCIESPQGTVSCDLGELKHFDSASFDLNVRLSRSIQCEGQARFISNTASVSNLAGDDLSLKDNQATDRAKVLCIKYEYAAKFVCGESSDDEAALLPGRYASVVNIHNPQDEEVFIFAKLAQALPPGNLQAGKLTPVNIFSLHYDEAASADCAYVRKEVFQEDSQPDLIDGFLVIQSPSSLDVTAVYSRREPANSDGGGSIDVEIIPERLFATPKPKPDLLPRILQSDLNCNSAGQCKMSIEYLVENIGEEMAGPFQASVTLLPADDVIATDEWDEGLLPGTSNIHIIQLQFPFSSVVQSKQMCIKADLPANVVVEKHEGNNIDCIDI